MDYKGVIQSIPLGDLGVQSDISQVSAPANSLMEAENISLRGGEVEREPGSSLWNDGAPLPAAIVGLYDFWPDDHTQRVIAVCSNGKVYKYLDRFNFVEVTPSGSAPTAINPGAIPVLVQGGAEQAGNNRKLFILTGNDPIQVISGDAIVRTNVSTPAADWGSGYYPSAGAIYNNRLVAWGNKNRPHCLYEASVTNHEDFTTNGSTARVDVYPGEGDRLETCFVYKSRLHATKYPKGFYYIDDSTDTTQVFRLGDSFGTSTPRCAIEVIDDMLIANAAGTITSLKAVFALGGVEQGDVMKSLLCSKFLAENTSPDGIAVRQALYYENKKQALFIYRSPSGMENDRILIIDFQSGAGKVNLNSKDQANCLALKRDGRILRPMYGDNDGNIFDMDRKNRNVNGVGYYSALRTNYTDFAFVNPALAEQDKIFEFLEIAFVPTGRFPLYADVFVDSRFVETRVFYQNRRSYMSRTASGGTFTLGKVRLRGKGPISIRKDLHAEGRRISIRVYATAADQNFIVSRLTLYFKVGGNMQRR